MKKTIHQKLKDANVPLGGHYSDLYAEVNEKSKCIIYDYEYRSNVTTFRNQITGTLWYDIPFANDDYKKFKRGA